MNVKIFEQLLAEGLITPEVLAGVQAAEKDKPVSLQWELKTLLYAGIVLFTTGVGIVIYNNLDSIGHLAIVIAIALTTSGCFAYCFKKSPPFTFKKAAPVDLIRDNVLLLGCLLLLTLIGYVQAQYQVFGDRWGMAAFVPMVLMFATAYYFDHAGVLSLAIVNLAAWAGLTVTPLRMLRDNDFSSSGVIYTGFVLGVFLTAMSLLSARRNIKAHFQLVYKNFGTHILFLSLVAAVVHFENIYLLFLLILAGVSYLHFLWARKEASFYFLVITSLYFYTGLSYVLINLLFSTSAGEGELYLALLYFILSGLGLVLFLIRYNKIFKKI